MCPRRHKLPENLQYDTAVNEMKIRANQYEKMNDWGAVKFARFDVELGGIRSLKELRPWP